MLSCLNTLILKKVKYANTKFMDIEFRFKKINQNYFYGVMSRNFKWLKIQLLS